MKYLIVLSIKDKISTADFVRHYFDNPKATRCRKSFFNGFSIKDKISTADFVRHYFDNPKATRCRSSLFNGFSIIGGVEQSNTSLTHRPRERLALSQAFFL